MNEEFKLHIKKLTARTTLVFIAILLAAFSLVLGIMFLFIPSFIAFILFAFTALCIVCLVYCNRIAKKEEKENTYQPVILNSEKSLTFEEIIGIFENITDKDNQLSTSEDVRFFRLNKVFNLRTVLYRTEDFNKKEFDNKKDRINKKANKEFNIPQWADRFEAGKMMRFNIIVTDTLNEELHQLLTKNAGRNLSRVEGVINIAIVGNQILIPPIYGDCDLGVIGRYKDVIRFIDQVLLSEQKYTQAR